MYWEALLPMSDVRCLMSMTVRQYQYEVPDIQYLYMYYICDLRDVYQATRYR